MLFFLFDEFENLQPYQQNIVNTLVKHCGGKFSIKIGMRPYGWSSRTTITGETLMEPMDYSIVTIGKRSDLNDSLAEKICNDRLAALQQLLLEQGVQADVPTDVQLLFPSLSHESEFLLLGGQEETAKLRQELKVVGVDASKLTDRELYTIATFSEPGTAKLAGSIEQYIEKPSALADKMNNYGYAALFTIRRGKRGIRKYYCGWRVMLTLSDGNIRFLLWLVHQCLVRAVEQGYTFGQPINPEIQTEAASDVGEKVLRELPDESQTANMLIRFVLGLGRVFQVLAAEPRGHLPEATQFSRKLSRDKVRDVDQLLQEGVRHLSLVEHTATKMQPGGVKDIDYSLHPIFSPFLMYSHRQKRKLTLSDDELLDLAFNPGYAHTLLRRLKANADSEMPEQMSLYEELFR